MNAVAASAVRERPILFSAPMVRALLAGTKTQTRRIVKVPESVAVYEEDCDEHDDRWHYTTIAKHPEKPCGFVAWMTEYPDDLHVEVRCPYGAVGDRLWVKETFAIESNEGIDDAVAYPPRFADGRPVRWHESVTGGRSWQQCHYRATEPQHDLVDYDSEDDKPTGWRPSIFMPRWASRIDLEIVQVRVERLHKITEADARAEGMHHHDGSPFQEPVAGMRWPTTLVVEARNEFRHLWNQINAERATWESNPWVFVVEFTRVRP